MPPRTAGTPADDAYATGSRRVGVAS